MGMLFNTPGTLRIISALNEAFNSTNFAILKNHAPAGFDPGNITGTGANGIFAKICQPLRLDDGDSGVSGHWHSFLGILDVTPPGVSVTKLSAQIGNAISNALGPGSNISAVEFFAVPDNVSVPSVQITSITDLHRDTTLIIK